MTQDILNIELPKLSSDKHKHKTFELIAIMDLTLNNRTNFYRLLFKDIHSSMYITEEVAPELLFYFAEGAYYRDSVRVDQDPKGKIGELMLSGSQFISESKGKLLTEHEFNFSHEIKDSTGRVTSFSKEMKEQYCLAYIFNDHTIVFPSHIVGTTFYFVSTNIRMRIFDSRPEKLYEDIGRHEDGTPFIYLKPGIALADGPYLFHYFENEHARKQWDRIRSSMTEEMYGRPKKTWHVPINILPPFRQTIKLTVRYSELPNKKILVHEVLGHESFFSFSQINVITSASENADNAQANKKIKKNSSRKNKKYVQRPPSDRNTFAGIRKDKELELLAYRGTELLHTTVDPGTPAPAGSNYEKNGKKTSVSSVAPVPGGDKDTSHLKTKQKAKKNKQKGKKKNPCKAIFTVEHFRKTMFALKQRDGIKGTELNINNIFPARPNTTKCNEKEAYDRECLRRRKWYYFRFRYKGNFFLIVDMDQTRLQSGSSIFILQSNNEIHMGDIREMLAQYATNNKRISHIEEFLLSKNITLHLKKHKCPKEAGFEQKWVDTFLDWI